MSIFFSGVGITLLIIRFVCIDSRNKMDQRMELGEVQEHLWRSPLSMRHFGVKEPRWQSIQDTLLLLSPSWNKKGEAMPPGYSKWATMHTF